MNFAKTFKNLKGFQIVENIIISDKIVFST